jgi:hypothetical protein
MCRHDLAAVTAIVATPFEVVWYRDHSSRVDVT